MSRVPVENEAQAYTQEAQMARSDPPLAGRVALITGAAQRIGAEIARTLHREGMDLALHYRRSEAEAWALRQALERDRPGSVLLVQADLGDTAVLPGLCARAIAFRGRLDLLVNNASSFYPTPIDTATEAQWDELIGSNLKGPFFLAQAAAPWLRASGGAIVNLVDIHGERPLKDHPIYCMAKAGNAMMVRALARDLGPAVRVNGVAPGAILWPEQGMNDQVQRQILARTALRRPGTPAEVARAVLFLVRDADYITGQIINVDGGRSVQQ
jgi:pteridine reductase